MDYDLAQADVAKIVAASAPLVFLLSLPLTMHFAQLATYRLGSRPFVRIGI